MARFEVKLQANNLTFSAFSSFSASQLAAELPSRIILLLHGFPDTNHSFDAVWPILEEKYPSSSKTLILAPVMRGYEPSSVVSDRSHYTVKHTSSDVLGWIKEIIGDKKVPVHLIGHDWGALAAFQTASDAPELINSISTLAIPYLANLKSWEVIWNCPEQIYLSSYMLRMQSSYLYSGQLYSSALTTIVDSNNKERRILPYIEGLWKHWSPGWKFTQDDLAEFCDAFQRPGVVDATTGYYYSTARSRKRDWIVDFDKVPTLLIGGRDDGCMSYKLYDLESRKLAEYGEEKVKVVQVDSVGHFMHRENPKMIIELCIDWIENHE